MTKPPVFVIGVSRSGTTLLRLMLDRHPAFAIPYESHFIDDWLARRTSLGDLTQPSSFELVVRRLLDEPMVALWNRRLSTHEVLAQVHERTLSGAIEALYRAYAAARAKPRWGDKSDHVETVPGIAAAFPDACFVHIVRDGRDVVRSVNRQPWGPDDVISAARWWSHQALTLVSAGRALGPSRYHELRYEELLHDPRTVLGRVCTFLDEPFDERMLDPSVDEPGSVPAQRRAQHVGTERSVDPSRAQAWRGSMPAADVWLIERNAGAALRELGYELSGVRVSRSAAAVAFARACIRRQLSRLHP